MLSILLLSLILALLVLQPLFFDLDEVLKIATIAVEPLRVEVDDVSGHGVQEVPVVGHNQDG